VEQILAVFGRLLKAGGVLSFFEYIAIRRVKQVVSGRAERQRLQEIGRLLGDLFERGQSAATRFGRMSRRLGSIMSGSPKRRTTPPRQRFGLVSPRRRGSPLRGESPATESRTTPQPGNSALVASAEAPYTRQR